MFLHERAASARFLSIINNYAGKLPGAVVHCFTGTLKEAKVYLDNGFYLGFTGAITDSMRFSHLEEVIRFAPLDRIMIETDAPYMIPKNLPRHLLTKFNERRNEPAFLPYVLSHVARLKDLPATEIAQHVTSNSIRFFKLPAGCYHTT